MNGSVTRALVEAIVASLLFNSAVILQSLDAREAPSELSMRPRLLWFLMRRRWWLIGTAQTIVAAVLQVFALERLSVAHVQAITAGGILLLPLDAWRRLRAPPTGAELLSILGIVAGVIAAGFAVPPQLEALQVPAERWIAGGIAIAAVALLLAWRARGVVLALVAGFGFGMAALFQKSVALEGRGGWMLAGVVAMGLTGAVGFLAEMSALQSASPSRVAASVLAVSSALPMVAAPFLFGERWPRPIVAGASLVVVVIAAAWIARNRPHGGSATTPAPARAG